MDAGSWHPISSPCEPKGLDNYFTNILLVVDDTLTR